MKKSLFIIYLGMSIACYSQSESDYLMGTTQYYEFYSNYWINMHHFLYQKALNSKKRRSIKDEEQNVFVKLTPNQLKIFKTSALFYKSNMLKQDLIFSKKAANIKWFLSHYKQDVLPEDDKEHGALFKVLNNFSSIYKSSYWKLHDASNQEKWALHKKTIIVIEDEVLSKLSFLAKNNLPDKKLRVDISAYTNWAGAYSTDYPSFHITLSSTRSKMKGTLWVETIFHESNHYLIDNEDSRIARVIKSEAKKLNVEIPDKLWHAILFYFVGTVTEDVFSNKNRLHTMYMKVHNTFSKYHKAVDQLKNYVEGKETLETGIYNAIKTYYNQ